MSSCNPRYGDRTYWNERYASSQDNPFDWLCDFDQLRPTLEQLVPKKDGLVLVVGCGDAPFSPDLYFRGQYKRTIHVDYSRVVVERQRRRYPEMDWREMDALDMPFRDDTFDAIIDKSLIDTTMCYQDGHVTTEKLFAELHRVLKPGGRLVTISLHSEDEVVRYRFSPATSHCRLLNKRRKTTVEPLRSQSENASKRSGIAQPQQQEQHGGYHSLAVFDKLEGTSIHEKVEILNRHPIQIVGAVLPPAPSNGRREDEYAGSRQEKQQRQQRQQLRHRWERNDGGSTYSKEEASEAMPQVATSSKEDGTSGSASSEENITQLMATIDAVLKDLMKLHDSGRGTR